MNAADTWLAILWLTLATILTRCSFFLLGRHAVRLPPKLQYALRYAPAAALAAIVAPDLLLANGELAMSWSNPKLMAGLGAVFGVFDNTASAWNDHRRHALVHFATYHLVIRKRFFRGVCCGKIAVFPFL